MNATSTQRRAEVRALGHLALNEIGNAAGGIGSIHRAISNRVFAGIGLGLGAKAEPVKIVHDAITDIVYSSIVESARAGGYVAGKTLDIRSADNAPVSETARGAVVIGAIQGLIGDVLEADQSPLATEMSVRVDGAVVPPTRDSLAAAFPNASSRIIVFVHGLSESEVAWGIGGRATYGERLEDALDASEVQVRFNTGRHISENGRSLHALLTELCDAWPVPITEIALIGHSMGGLVARSACHQAATQEAAWVHSVGHTVSLGTPHLGAPLEQFVHRISAALVAVPETRAFGRLLRRRSSGIRDLHQGSLVDEDWRGRDRDALRLAAYSEVPLLPDAMHCFVSGTVTTSPSNPFGRVIGDGLVLLPSASGVNRTRRIGFREEDGFHVPGAHHLALLNHDAVYDKLLMWLSDSGDADLVESVSE
ncbi:MAG: alpha/beta hydrolase [Rhodococcus sp.]|nr:alpha/beta hydrolase [Rhodococcus sp. (in: high G+C Gram-positive bacteria)]